MIKKFIARWFNLHTEENCQLMIYDKCKMLRQIMNKEYHEKTKKIAQKGLDLLIFRNPMHYRFMAVFPFVSKQNIFYWITVEIPHNESYEGYHGAFWVTDPNFLSDSPGKMYFTVKNKKAKIEDIVVSRQNQGIGSHLLALLEHLVTHLGVEEITGMLSPVDAEHRPAQVSFYKKNGYAVTLSSDGQYGSIKKHLSKSQER